MPKKINPKRAEFLSGIKLGVLINIAIVIVAYLSSFLYDKFMGGTVHILGDALPSSIGAFFLLLYPGTGWMLLLQALYATPLVIWLRRSGRKTMSKGVIWVAGLMSLASFLGIVAFFS